jgi:hypothetical protein
MNPLYHSQEAWRHEISSQSYDADYIQTQVLGLDGGEGTSAFPVVASAPIPFKYANISESDISTDDKLDALIQELDFNSMSDAEEWAIHSDYGHSPSPMIIGISYRIGLIWFEYARLHALKMHSVAAARLLNALDLALPKRPNVIAMDPHGRGAGTYETLHHSDQYQAFNYKERLISADFHTRLEDPRIMVHKVCNRVVRELSDPGDHSRYWNCDNCRRVVYDDEVIPQKVGAKQLYAVDLAEAMVRGSQALNGEDIVDFAVVLAEADEELRNELAGTMATTSPTSGHVTYEPPQGKNVDHNTDTWRCLMAVTRYYWNLEAQHHYSSVLDEFGFF